MPRALRRKWSLVSESWKGAWRRIFPQEVPEIRCLQHLREDYTLGEGDSITESDVPDRRMAALAQDY